MNRTVLNEKRMATSGQMKDVYSLMIQAVPELTFEEATIALCEKSSVIKRVRACFARSAVKDDTIASWKLFYTEVFGIILDLSVLKIPEKREGFDRLIVVANGLTLNGVYDACTKKFPCRCYTEDLNIAVPTNDRIAKESYAVWVRERVEADEELKNQSADNLADQKIIGITLLERMLYELKYFMETGKHLDIENWTLCSGSRDSDGFVPYAYWCDGRFGVGWLYRSCRSLDLRSREAVSL